VTFNYIKDVFLLITWVVATFNNKSAISDVDLEPDEGEELEDQDNQGPDNMDDEDENLENQ